TVKGDVDARTFPSRVKIPGRPPILPCSSDELEMVDRIHHHIANSRMLIDVQHFSPRIATIGSFIQSACFGRAPCTSHCPDIDNRRIIGVDQDAMDRLCVFKAGALPCLAAIPCSVYASAAVL